MAQQHGYFVTHLMNVTSTAKFCNVCDTLFLNKGAVDICYPFSCSLSLTNRRYM